jgi:hypothetical protein
MARRPGGMARRNALLGQSWPFARQTARTRRSLRRLTRRFPRANPQTLDRRGSLHNHALVKVLLVVAGGMLAIVLAIAGWIYYTTNVDAASGPGWRLVGTSGGGPWSLYSSEQVLAEPLNDQASVAELWTVLDLEAPIPQPDFANEVLVRATGFGSGSCPLHLDSVETGPGGIVVRMSSGFWLSCSGDAVPYTFIVVVERDRVPHGPFPIQVQTAAAASN